MKLQNLDRIQSGPGVTMRACGQGIYDHTTMQLVQLSACFGASTYFSKYFTRRSTVHRNLDDHLDPASRSLVICRSGTKKGTGWHVLVARLTVLADTCVISVSIGCSDCIHCVLSHSLNFELQLCCCVSFVRSRRKYVTATLVCRAKLSDISKSILF